MSNNYLKPLSQILANLELKIIASDPQITDITTDSREVKTGALFCALKGLRSDGRNYIDTAVKQGAAAVIYEANELSLEQQKTLDELSIPIIAISGLHEYIGYLAAAFFDFPSQSLRVFGITGTNGKTSCAYILTQCLEGLGYKVGFLGTIGYGELSSLKFATHTTFDAITLQRHLAEMKAQGISHVCMEVSSHALDQFRVEGTEFYGVMLTNVSHDHLDYHKTMDNYAAAKRRLFTDFYSKFAVLNADDNYAAAWMENVQAEYIVSFGQYGDVMAEDIVASTQGLQFDVETDSVDFNITTSLIGLVNVPNVLLVASALLVLGVEVSDIQNQLQNLQAAPGRMELFAVEGKPTFVVDFAHTPDALERALESLREHCKGALWCVFGCGGDRDVDKRPMMGVIAEKFADNVVVTSDNPRTENPEKIIADITSDINNVSALTIIESREQAIQWVLNQAQATDWILVAGKGHEDYQIVGNKKLPYSDRLWVAECLEVAA